MKKNNPGINRAAVISGISLLLMAILAGAANFQVIETIKASLKGGDNGSILVSMYGPGIRAALAFVAVVILDMIVAWSLYELFLPEMPALSLLTAWFRLLYSAVFAVSIVILFSSFRLAESSPGDGADAFLLFNEAWTVGLIFFGVHLILLGRIMLRSVLVHWIFGILMIISGLGYLFDSLMFFLYPDSDVNIALYTFMGEVFFIFWLLIKGPGLKLYQN